MGKMWQIFGAHERLKFVFYNSYPHNTDQVYQPFIVYKVLSHLNMLPALWDGQESIIFLYPFYELGTLRTSVVKMTCSLNLGSKQMSWDSHSGLLTPNPVFYPLSPTTSSGVKVVILCSQDACDILLIVTGTQQE